MAQTPKRPWTDEEIAVLRQMLAARYDYHQIAQALDRTYGSVKGYLAAHTELTGKGASKALWEDAEHRDAMLLDWPTFRAKYPERTHAAYSTARQRFRQQLASPAELVNYLSLVERVEGDAVIAACVHVPQTDPRMWARLLAVGQIYGIKTLIIAGDIVTGDMFSKWAVVEKYAFEDEMESLRLHLRAALAVYDQIVITPGNHISNRIVRMTNGHIRLAEVIQMAGLMDEERARIKTTEVDFIELHSGGERFLVGHASNYSKIDGRVPTWYAEIRESHVITGNGHRLGFGVSRSGRWHGYEIGTMANPDYMGYAQRQLTNYPRMMQGFATVRNGAVRLYGADKPFTDWEAEVA